ncbi:MAG TPA: tol-pal system protein YbgF, partial [Microscillaceae bacterium]|nr:tol-pal system protein YbgF [Microscillaceae bacterium]
YAERRNWGKAIGAGKNAMAYVRRGAKIDDMNVELLFGAALYNYFSVWIYDNYPILRPVIALFRKGDKALGLEQMQKVANNAFYTRTEAQYFLMRIYRDEEENPANALPIAKYLHKTFPENAYFHRSYAALNFILGYWDETLLQSNEILQRVQNQQAGYGAEAGRYASYFLGYIYQWQGDKARAKDFFMQAVAYAEQTGAYEYGYYHAALAYLARMAKESGNATLAKAYYAKLNKHLEKKGEYADEFKDETKEFLKAYKKVKVVME